METGTEAPRRRAIDADDGWCWGLERLLFLLPPLVGVGLVGVLGETGTPYLADGLVLFTTVGYAALTVGIPLCIVMDARDLAERSPDAVGGWRPRGWLYALAAVISAPIGGVVYLYRRHEHVATAPGGEHWWAVVAVALGAYLLGLALTIVGFVFAVPGVLRSGLGLAGAVVYGVFPIAIYEDATYVRARHEAWRPNPALYLGVAFLGLFVAVLQPVLAGYYLARRYGDVEVR
ncbi:hypothetical protein ACNS7O_06720 [Haloferacaceae archaeon DSL9]